MKLPGMPNNIREQLVQVEGGNLLKIIFLIKENVIPVLPS